MAGLVERREIEEGIEKLAAAALALAATMNGGEMTVGKWQDGLPATRWCPRRWRHGKGSGNFAVAATAAKGRHGHAATTAEQGHRERKEVSTMTTTVRGTQQSRQGNRRATKTATRW